MAKTKPKEKPTSPKKKPISSEIISRRYMGSLSDEEMGAIDKHIDQLAHDVRVAMRDDPWVDPKTNDRITVGGAVDGDSEKSAEEDKEE